VSKSISLRRLANEFWEATGVSACFPRDMERAVLFCLPLAVVKLPALQTSTANGYLCQRGFPALIQEFDSKLHACLIAFAGYGFAFLDGSDPENEQRFSLSHEAAHFMLHYLLPRKRAIEVLGPGITGVLDGYRPATITERIEAVLSNVCIGVHTHILPADSTQSSSTLYASVEYDADMLAIELLAPEGTVKRQLLELERPSNVDEMHHLVTELLVDQFGLPSGVANLTARKLCAWWNNPFSIRKWLGLQDNCRISAEWSE
jgi:hypothetical protein